MMLIIDETDHPLIIKVASIPQTRIQVYFIDNDDYFTKRQMEVDENGNEYADNGERAVFFARGVLETVKKLRWMPDVILCQGWMSSLVPFYVKTAYREEPSFKNVKVITALWSKGPKRDMGKNFKQNVEFKSAKASLLKAYKDKFTSEDLGRLAIDYSDALVDAPEGLSEKLVAYAEETGLPMLPYTAEGDLGQVYDTFCEGLF
jgi:starch synthase